MGAAKVALALALAALGHGLQLSGGVSPRAPAACRSSRPRMITGSEWRTANVPRAKVTMNPLENLMQMQVRAPCVRAAAAARS